MTAHGPRPTAPRLRPATMGDAVAIAAIYNEAVATTVATFDTEPRSLAAQRAWLREHRSPWTVIVAEAGGKVQGWAALTQWSDRKAYSGTAEVSVYVASERRGQGWGGHLLDGLLTAAENRRFHTLLARIADPNPASFRLHRRRGFEVVGTMREVGWKFNRWVDVQLLQRISATRPSGEPPVRASAGRPVSRSSRRTSSG